MCPRERSGKPCERDPKAQLVDVRTDAEWSFVGLPDLSSLGKQVVPIQWQLYPTMVRNTAFTEQLRQAGFTPDHHIYFICRSGQRSLAAAQAAQAAGFLTPTMLATGSRAMSMPTAIAALPPAGKPRACPGGSDRFPAS